jgi:hypothetical protein
MRWQTIPSGQTLVLRGSYEDLTANVHVVSHLGAFHGDTLTSTELFQFTLRPPATSCSKLQNVRGKMNTGQAAELALCLQSVCRTASCRMLVAPRTPEWFCDWNACSQRDCRSVPRVRTRRAGCDRFRLSSESHAVTGASLPQVRERSVSEHPVRSCCPPAEEFHVE